MLGGPFIDYPPSRVGEIRELIEQTQRECADLIGLAKAIDAFDKLLLQQAKGGSLEPLYDQLPQPLRGYVELSYDLHHRPSMRLMEGLLYKSRLFNPSTQSVAIAAYPGDTRSFALSTPRLDGDAVHLPMPFTHPAVDLLAEMRTTSRPMEQVRDVLQLDDDTTSTLTPYFTDAPPASRPTQVPEGQVRVRYFGHACVLIESKDTSILVDPLIAYKGTPEVEDRFSFDDLPERIDYVLITHSHQDHFVVETLLQLRHKVDTVVVPQNTPGSLVDPSLKWALYSLGFDKVIQTEAFETISVAGGRITTLPFLGEHGDLEIQSKLAFLVELGNTSVMLVADSNNLDPTLYQHIRDICGDIDILFVGMECAGAPMSWLYGPFFSQPVVRKHDQARRLNGSNATRAMDLVEKLAPKEVFVYAMGAEPWITFVSSTQYTDSSPPIVESNQFIEACRQRGLTASRLHGKHELHLSR